MLVLGLRLKSQAQHSWFGQDVENLLLSSQLSQSGELYVSTLYLYHLHSGDIVIPAENWFAKDVGRGSGLGIWTPYIVHYITGVISYTLLAPAGFGIPMGTVLCCQMYKAI